MPMKKLPHPARLKIIRFFIMSQIIGLVTKATKPISSKSNCKISKEGQNIVLTDDTPARPFIQKHSFANIATDFNGVIQKIPSQGSMRVISICSEYSTPTVKDIREYSMQMIMQRIPPNSNDPTPISVGLVYDANVFDFVNIEGGRTEDLELLEAENIYEALDLIEFSFERFKRFRECMFVLHVGYDDAFFEWVIVPSADSFVPTPSMAGLAPNEKFIFILKSFPTLNAKSFERYANLTNVFRLVCDTFLDIPTLWIIHFAKQVTFKSNASLIKISEYINDASKVHFDIRVRSNLFHVKPFDDLPFDIMSEMTFLNELQREEALREQRKLQNALMKSGLVNINFDDTYSHWLEMEEEEEEEAEYDSMDMQGERRSKKSSRGRRRIRNKFHHSDEELSDDPELLERRRQEEELAKREAETLEALKNVQRYKKKKKSRNTLARKPGETSEDEEIRLKKERKEKENEQFLAKLNDLRKRRTDKIAELKRQKALKAEKLAKLKSNEKKHLEVKSKRYRLGDDQFIDVDSPEMSLMRERISARMEKLKKRLLEEQEREASEYEEEEEKKERKKRYVDPKKQREKQYIETQLLAMEARKLAENPQASLAKMRNIHEKIMKIIGNRDEHRKNIEAQILALKAELKEKQRQHEMNQQDLKDIRELYLETHTNNDQMIMNSKNQREKILRNQKMKARLIGERDKFDYKTGEDIRPEFDLAHYKNKGGFENGNGKESAYSRTIRLLNLEISNVKSELQSIRQRVM